VAVLFLSVLLYLVAGCENVGLSFEADSVDDDTPVCGRRSGRDSGSRDDELESFLDVDIPRRGGPRIKHVSRSQHLVVGLPLATYVVTENGLYPIIGPQFLYDR